MLRRLYDVYQKCESGATLEKGQRKTASLPAAVDLLRCWPNSPRLIDWFAKLGTLVVAVDVPAIENLLRLMVEDARLDHGA
jgi:hypothetical protein